MGRDVPAVSVSQQDRRAYREKVLATEHRMLVTSTGFCEDRYERGEDGSESEWGKVLHWEPPARLILAWQIDGSWKYNPACVTEVEINFTALGAQQTRVDLEHRHLERLGDNASAVRELLNSGWGGILELYGKQLA